MEVELSTLMSAVGRAVQDAQSCLEHQAITNYCAYYTQQPSLAAAADRLEGESLENGGESRGNRIFSPVSRCFSLPGGEQKTRQVEVAEAALVRHDTMSLDTVHVHLNLQVSLRREDGAILARVGPGDEEANGEVPYSQLEMTFRGTPMAEGIARVNQETIKYL